MRRKESSNVLIISLVISLIVIAIPVVTAVIVLNTHDPVKMRRLYVDYMIEKQYVDIMNQYTRTGEFPDQVRAEKRKIESSLERMKILKQQIKKEYGCSVNELYDRLDEKQRQIAIDILYNTKP